MKSLAGNLLVAVPELFSPPFTRSVILLFQHDHEGASGVILNQPTSITVGALWDEISEAECDCDHPVNCGGPVEGPLLAIHQMPKSSERVVVDDVYLSMQSDSLHCLVMQQDIPFRIFSGYSGWGPNQLECEIEQGSWLILPADASHVFGESDKLWRRVCEHVGHDVLKPHLGKLRPVDPSLN